ncbi:MAG: hypothetical protein AAF564_12025 [Bacteroidota bacterium]
MNNMLRFASLTLFVLVGCNEASIPLGPPESAPTDQQLVGYWQIEDPDSENLDGVEYLVILPFNENEYLASFTSDQPIPADDLQHMRVFLSDVGPHMFANVQLLSTEQDEGFFIYQYEIDSSGLLTLKHVDHDMDDITTSEALRTFVSDVVARQDFDKDDILTFRKVELAQSTRHKN